jgi:hypothetical protein
MKAPQQQREDWSEWNKLSPIIYGGISAFLVITALIMNII